MSYKSLLVGSYSAVFHKQQRFNGRAQAGTLNERIPSRSQDTPVLA